MRRSASGEGARPWGLLLLPLVLLAASGGRVGSAGETGAPAGIDERLAALERDQHRAAGERGATVFRRSCAACHGRTGKGDGPGAADLDPRPRDLSSRQYRFRTTASGDPPRAEDLERTIRAGLPGSSMPGFGSLFSEREIADLIAFVQDLGGSAPADPIVVPPIPAATPEAVADGRTLYLLMGCGSCHGMDGSGRGPAAAGLTDENGRPIRATDFRHDPLKGGREAQAIARTLLTGLNGAPMPSFADALLFAREEVADLTPFDGQVSGAEAQGLADFVRAAPTREELQALGESGRRELRDRRVAALAHYVLSIDRRRALGYRWFGQQPEREARAR